MSITHKTALSPGLNWDQNVFFGEESGYTHTHGLTELCGKHIFSPLRNYQIISQTDSSIFHLYQQCMRVLVFLHPSFHLAWGNFNFNHSSQYVVVSDCGVTGII